MIQHTGTAQNLAEAMRRAQKREAASGLLLMGAAALALLIANSGLAPYYETLLSTKLALLVDGRGINKPLLLWINDGLMAVFFLQIGLEIKREVLLGELRSWNKAALPVIAAVGGMLVPAAVYLIFNVRNAPVGWAVPAATDIAFALGVLALLGPRVPVALKIFLMALAIIDDLGAILIIAFFYTSKLSVLSLLLAAGAVVALWLLNRRGVRTLTAYLLLALFLWVCVLKSGVHATLAGVLAAAFIPADRRGKETESPLAFLEHRLHPWVAFGIMPIFAFGNAGVSLEGVSFAALLQPLPLGIALGLFLGKQIGVFAFSFAAVKFGLARLPAEVRWPQLYGVALLTGIGFTMSLFIGTLAFSDPSAGVPVRLGVLLGSVLSALAGYAWLRLLSRRATP